MPPPTCHFEFSPAAGRPALKETSLRHGRRRPAIHVCVPGMALILEVQVLYGPIGRNR